MTTSSITGDYLDAQEVRASLEDFFRDTFTTENVAAMTEASELTTSRWTEVAEMGLPTIGVDELKGGGGGSLAHTVAMCGLGGQYAVPLPLMEAHLAAWLAGEAGGTIDTSVLSSVVPPGGSTLRLTEGRLYGRAAGVAWGRSAEVVVANVSGAVTVINPREGAITEGVDLAGQPRDTIDFDGVPVHVLPDVVDPYELELRGMLLRSAQMAGAMTTVFALANKYAAERVQFGRPINKFQAVRQHLAKLSEWALLSDLVVNRAAAACSADRLAPFEINSTKLIVNQDAGLVVRAGHQVHGAIGMTREFPLHLYTRRLQAWRGEWGNELDLAHRIGEQIHTQDIVRIATSEGSVSL